MRAFSVALADRDGLFLAMGPELSRKLSRGYPHPLTEIPEVGFPTERALRSWWIYLSLTLASALVAHLAFDAADSGLAALVTRPIHVLYALIVAVAFAGAAFDVYGHGSAERRRRVALMQSALGDRRTPMLVSFLVQVALAGGTVRVEGPAGGGPQLLLSVLCAVAAMLVGALLLRRIESSILRLVLAAFAGRRPRGRALRSAAMRPRVAAAVESAYHLFRPNRPPPLFA